MSVVLDLFQMAHDLGAPHAEPVSAPGGSGGGASAVVVILVIVASIAAVGALVWLKKRAED